MGIAQTGTKIIGIIIIKACFITDDQKGQSEIVKEIMKEGKSHQWVRAERKEMTKIRANERIEYESMTGCCRL